MNNLIYLSILFLASCTINQWPDCPESDSVNVVDSVVYDTIGISDKQIAWADSIWGLFLEKEAYINEKYKADSILVDTLMKIRSKIKGQVIQNISGNMTIQAEPGGNVDAVFDSVTGKPKLIIR